MEFLLEIGVRLVFLPIELLVCWVTDRWPWATAFALLLVGLIGLACIAWWTSSFGLAL